MLKKRLKEEGADQLLTNRKQLKMTAADGKKRLPDVANTEQLLRSIQSIPPKKRSLLCSLMVSTMSSLAWRFNSHTPIVPGTS